MTRTSPRLPQPRRRRASLAVATTTFVVLLAALMPSHALAVDVSPEPAIASEGQAAADAESCDINPGLDNPTYNNVCPLWVSPITSEEVHGNPAGRGLPNTGWFTRAAPSGEYVVTAGWQRTDSFLPRQMVLVATRAGTGERLWVRHYPTGVASPVSVPGFVESVPLAMVFSPDSRYLYVAGWTHHPFTNLVFKLGFALKADAATGDIVWATTIGDLTKVPLAVARDIAVSPDGRHVYVTGDNIDWDCVDCQLSSSPETWPPRAPFVSALDASSGDVLWRVDDPDPAGAYGWQLTLSPDGRHLYQVQSVLYPDWWTKAIRVVAYDTATGEQVWASQYDYPPAPAGMKNRNRQNPPVGVMISPDGDRVFVTTSHLYWRASDDPGQPILTNINFLALAWDAATGEQLWTSEHDWSSQAGCADGLDFATGAALSPAGERLYVVGSVIIDQERRGTRCEVGDPGNSTLGLLALDTKTGQENWSRLYHNAEHQVAAPIFASFNSLIDIHILADNVHVKPGQGPSDQGSQLYVSAMASKSGDVWILGLGFDGLTGRQVWQARHNPTGEPPDPLLQGSTLSPDGGAFYVTAAGFPRNSTVINIAYPTADETG